ncbi:MAG: hypothetical protein OEV78_05320 [Spirochaetia bacterium]|nr:hypothetical protein [Spirochaetia bacterium]
MKNLKVKLRKIILLTGLSLTSVTIFECYSWDIMGKMYSPAPLMVFVTSNVTPGDMNFTLGGAVAFPQCPNSSGLLNANCVCQQSAINAGLITSSKKVFRAWLSDSTTDAICNIVGIKGKKSCGSYKPTKASYVDINGNLLFYSWDYISNGGIPLRNIDTTEINSAPPGVAINAPGSWTGTMNGGTLTSAGSHCTDWTIGTTAMNGEGGNYTILSSWTWDGSTTGVSNTCTNTYSIYCFEQP